MPVEAPREEELYIPKKLNRVVVVGLGAVTPLGNNVEDTWQGLIEGRSGIRRISSETGREWDGFINSVVDIAGLVKDFDVTSYIPRKLVQRAHLSARYSAVATLQALFEAGLLSSSTFVDGQKPQWVGVESERVGARIGTGIGGGSVIADIEDTIRERGDSRIGPFEMLRLLSERVVTVPSILLGIRGPVSSVVAACATGSIAIGDAVDKIRLGKADVMVAGGTEAAVHRVGVGAFNAMRALSTDNNNPTFASRPFNADVSGFVMAEGSGVLALESLEHVIKRGAENKILAEVVGYAETADAYDDTDPSGVGPGFI